VRRLAAVALLACLLAGCGGGGQTPSAVTQTAPTNGDGFAIDPPQAAPAFLLRDQDGRLVGPQTYRGHWTVVTFLYTHCPDVCPLIASRLAAAQRRDAGLRVVAVSVDPARDTRLAVRRFLAAHHAGPAFRYVTGTRRQLAKVWRAYHVAALPGPSATVSHSSISVLVDPAGRERMLFDSSITTAGVLRAAA